MQVLAFERADAVLGGDRSFMFARNLVDERQYLIDVPSLSRCDKQVQIVVADVAEYEIDDRIEARCELPIDFIQKQQACRLRLSSHQRRHRDLGES